MVNAKISLKIRRSYKIETYPRGDIANASFLGQSDNKYIFSIDANPKGLDGFLLVDRHWMCMSEQGAVTLSSFSSATITHVPRDPKKMAPYLVKQLQEVRAL